MARVSVKFIFFLCFGSSALTGGCVRLRWPITPASTDKNEEFKKDIFRQNSIGCICRFF